MKKVRLDVFLVENGLSLSREKAKREIIAGWVKVSGETLREPSKKIPSDSDVSVERPGGQFVSRGGEKLQKALDFFNLQVEGKVTLDLGASTGGFTDCMLKSGALKVYSVDVGYNQLDYTLRTDERVVVMERTHAKDLDRGMFSENIDFFTADLSFISIIKILPVVITLFDKIEGVVLIKPQFEAKSGEHKKGVVKDPDVHVSILERTLKSIIEIGFTIGGVTFSPIKGPAGNIEFLAYISSSAYFEEESVDIKSMVKDAHESLD